MIYFAIMIACLITGLLIIINVKNPHIDKEIDTNNYQPLTDGPVKETIDLLNDLEQKWSFDDYKIWHDSSGLTLWIANGAWALKTYNSTINFDVLHHEEKFLWNAIQARLKQIRHTQNLTEQMLRQQERNNACEALKRIKGMNNAQC